MAPWRVSAAPSKSWWTHRFPFAENPALTTRHQSAAGAVPRFARTPGKRPIWPITAPVAVTETRDAATTFEVDSDKGRDIRADVASAVVRGGWSLLELRPSRVSLEDVFLKLMTEERDPNAPDAPVAAGAPAEAPDA